MKVAGRFIADTATSLSGVDRRNRCVVVCRLGYMLCHVRQDTADVLVGKAVENLFAVPFRLHDTRSAKQPQVVTHQRRREFKLCGNIADTARSLKAGEDDPQPALIAHQPKHFGKFGCLIVGD
jgi:hypothetical protein